MQRLAIVIAALACGCTGFDSIDPGVCGNGLIDVGEDCDSNEASCVSCAVACTSASDCPTASYACGVDGLCHAPGGALDQPEPAGPFQISDLAVTDLDGDGIGDVFGVSRTSIVIRYGDPSGRLTRVESLITPSQTGAAAFGQLDDDGALDLTIATEDGLVAYTSEFGGLAPLSVASPIVDGGNMATLDIRYLFEIGRLTAAGFVVDLTTGNIALLIFDFIQGAVIAQPCVARLGPIASTAFTPSSIDIYKVGPDDIVVSMLVETSPRKLCVLAFHKPLFTPWTVSDITPANAPGLSRRPILGDLDTDADRCPDLVNTDGGGPALRRWTGSMAAGGCTLQAAILPMGAALPPASLQASIVVVGRIPLDPPFPGLASDLLVMSDGVYAFDPGATGGFARVYTSQRRLAGAVSADLDEDGMADGVLIPATEDDVDVMYRRPSSVVFFLPGYLVLRVDTASRVVNAKIADFDGNGRLDIALLEQLTSHQRLIVAYGTTDLLLPPVTVGMFKDVVSLASIGLYSIEDFGGNTDDLFVVQPPPPGGTTSMLTLLHGSALRTMIPYFDPRPDPDTGPSVREATLIRDVIIGQFASPGGIPGHVDIAALAVDRADLPGAPQLWRLPVTPLGPDAAETPGIPTSGLADCVTGGGSGLCVRDASYLAWPISPAKDVVIAIDRAATVHAVMFDPQATGSVSATALTKVTALLPPATVLRALYAADLDGDGLDELVVSAAPRPGGQSTGALVWCQMSGGLPTSCEDLVPAILEGTRTTEQAATSCIDAAPARIELRDRFSATSPARDLVVACRGDGAALYRVHRGSAGLEVSFLVRTTADLESIRVGDVTGDGVDDVLAIEGDSGARSLSVFPQCSSRGLAACTRPSTGTSTGGGGS